MESTLFWVGSHGKKVEKDAHLYGSDVLSGQSSSKGGMRREVNLWRKRYRELGTEDQAGYFNVHR